MNRRAFIGAGGMLGLTALAGCGAAGAGKPSRTEPPGSTLPVEPDYGDWFAGVSNYEATADRRGESAVTVRVDSEANMGAFGFDPAAVAVSPGTTVAWTTTGAGGGHNVVSETGAFHSGALVRTTGHTFTHRFVDPGTYRYVCEPHRKMGMRSAVVVLAGDPGT